MCCVAPQLLLSHTRHAVDVVPKDSMPSVRQVDADLHARGGPSRGQAGWGVAALSQTRRCKNA